ncbi:DNA topoisomerase [Sphingomonas sp. 3-13AW]|uniref:DNA topoisomerase n=1 Tax=Sphingomonas sp. 3-13AW TaxID=3050450 RepID=UPI003BB5BF81
MRLWLAEKRISAQQIASILGEKSREGGFITLSNGDVMTWASGHLLESYKPHEYDERYKKWNVADLPIIPRKFLRKPIEDGNSRAQLRVICGLVKKADEIVIATDPAREGEAIAWYVLEHAGWKGPTLRFWNEGLDPTSVNKAAANLLDASKTKPYYMAARLRSSMDWCDGMSWSRYYQMRACEYGDEAISIGRVQTATLAMLVDRDLEIENFVPKDYFEVRAGFDLPEGHLDLMYSPAEEKRILNPDQAEEIARSIRGADAVLKVEKKPKTFTPPPPFNLAKLQTVASARFGWPVNKTLEVLQKLYEAGAVTYPRTEFSHLPETIKGDMPAHLAALRKKPAFRDLADVAPTIRPKIFNSSKVGDHHGIITTDKVVDVVALGPDAAKLFDLVARQFLAALLPDAKGATTTISSMIEGVPFKASGTIISTAGWKAVWGKDDPGESDPNADKMLPAVKDGQRAQVDEAEVLKKVTRPPAFYTEGSLVEAMATAGSKSDDPEVKELLQSGGGLGTAATRAAIIEKLAWRHFTETSGKRLMSTRRGRELVAVIRADGNRLVDVIATADLERELRAIEKNPATAIEIWHRFTKELEDEMERLKRGPAPRKLTALPRGEGRSSSRAASRQPSRSGGSRSSAAPASPRKSPAKSGARKTPVRKAPPRKPRAKKS